MKNEQIEAYNNWNSISVHLRSVTNHHEISYIIVYYDMASSASGQDEPNRALWLAIRAGKMERSCPLGTTRCIPHEKFLRKPYNKSFIDQVCSVKMVGYWPRSSFASLWTSTSSRSINTQKYPAILTSHLVNNPYLSLAVCWIIYSCLEN